MTSKRKFNEKNILKVLQQSIDFSIDIKSEYCSSDHIIYCILKNINENKKYEEFSKKYNLDELLEELKYILVQNYGNSRNFSGVSVITDYIVDFLSKKTKQLEKNNIFSISEIDILICLLYEINNFVEKRGSDAIFHSFSFSEAVIFSKFDKDRFLVDLKKIKEQIGDKIDKENQLFELENEIRNVCVILNDLIKENKIDELIGREKEIFSIAKILCRRTKNNVVLVGDPGVGKTSIVEGLALKIYKKQIFKQLQNFEIFSVSVTDLVAGTKYRGDLEEKIKRLIENLIKYSELKNVFPVLFIDEIHMIINSGTSTESKVDIANMLKPVLQKGKLRIIGSTTHEEFRQIQKDNALRRRFQKLHVDEPSVEDTKLILKGIVPYYESYHKVKISEEALEKIPYLAKKYLSQSFLPDSAIDLVDITSAKLKLINQESENVEVKLKDVIEVVSEITNTPVEKITETNTVEQNVNKFEYLKNLSSKIKTKIFGQDEAVDTIVSTIITAKAGLRDDNKPEAVFLLNGPTGTGKTELCKILAEELNMKFLRIDMSEYMEKHSVAKLIGAPPGYVGYNDTEGFLISNIEKNPNSLILFDEIEKAHSDVLNLFLQIFDYGKLTSSSNKTVKFNNTIIMMTSNLGNTVYSKKQFGFVKGDEDDVLKERQKEEIFKYLSPEFRNRLDNIIIFNKLNEDTCLKIIQKFIDELQEKVKDKNITITLDDSAKKHLLEKGFDENLGARPLARVINREIKEKLAPEMLFGSLVNGGEAVFSVENGNIILLNSKK